jgi:hypothetical protein
VLPNPKFPLRNGSEGSNMPVSSGLAPAT